MIRAVTGFVPIADNPRGVEEYTRLGAPLLEAINPLYAQCEIHQCWLYRYLDWTKLEVQCSTADNPQKNTPAYHIVQHQKLMWLMMGAHADPTPDVLAWIDFGILSVPGVTVAVIEEFLEKAASEKAIVMPGCWPHVQQSIDDSQPCWRFCGGLMVVPRALLMQFDLAFRTEAIRHIQATRRLSWEVNTLARLEARNELPIQWYQADHDQTMFTNYMETIHAG